MNHTTFSRETSLIPGKVSGYTSRLAPPGAVWNSSLGLGGGDYASTAADVATWLQALLEGHVVSPASLKAMTTGFRLKNGRVTRYGYGLDLFELQGHRYLGHTGDGLGFHAAGFGVSDARLAVVVLYNGEPDLEPAYFAKRLAAIAPEQPIHAGQHIAEQHGSTACRGRTHPRRPRLRAFDCTSCPTAKPKMTCTVATVPVVLVP